MNTKVQTLQSVANILKSMLDTSDSMIGQDIVVRVTRISPSQQVLNADKQPVPAADGSGDLMRKICNTNYVSHIAKSNPRNLETLAKGQAFEKAGDFDKAEAEYQTLRNKVQLTFNVLSSKGIFDEIRPGDQVVGRLEKVTTPKGSFLTLSNVVRREPTVGKVSSTAWLTALEDLATGPKAEKAYEIGDSSDDEPIVTGEDPSDDEPIS